MLSFIFGLFYPLPAIGALYFGTLVFDALLAWTREWLPVHRWMMAGLWFILTTGVALGSTWLLVQASVPLERALGFYIVDRFMWPGVAVSALVTSTWLYLRYTETTRDQQDSDP